MNGSRLLVRPIVLVIPLALGCETAAILLGGAGAGSSGGRNQGLDAVERKRDREAEAQRANTEKCFYLLHAISQQRSMVIAGHEQERGALKDELQLRLAAASTETGRADAYSRFADDLQRSAAQFQASSKELDAKEKALGDCE